MKQEGHKKWKTDIKDCSIIDEKKSDFLLNEVKLALQSYLDGVDKIEKKAFIFIGILLGIMPALVGFFITKYDFNIFFLCQKWLVHLSLILIVCYLGSFFFFKRALSPARFKPLGNTPQNLATNVFFSSDLDLMKFKEAESYQERIEQCVENATRKSKNLSRGLNMAFSIPIFLTVLFISNLKHSFLLYFLSLSLSFTHSIYFISPSSHREMFYLQ